LKKLSEGAVSYYGKIADGRGLGLEYKPSVKLPEGACEIDDITAAFRQSLEEFSGKEQVIETSMVGIHRDDVYFTIESLPARTHGSQGEWRTAAIALKLAVYHLIKERRGVHPVLLLDEIFAELDNDRCRGLMGAFEDFEQLFITTAAELPEFLKNGSRSYRIADGAIGEVN
ncbi:MAG: DNA replication/repair protein RecF, partial [Planctomycetota bacterium]